MAEDDGGALFIDSPSSEVVVISNSRFDRNSGERGGSIFTKSPWLADSCVFSGNSGAAGGSIDNQVSLALLFSIFPH
jgi:hypothetical protein